MLTDTKCRNAKAKDKAYKLTDTNGLFLEVKPTGVKAWRYRFELRQDGQVKESTFALGDYASAPAGETPEEALARRAGGQLTLAEAREERTKARALVKQGINPAHARKVDRKKRELDMSTTFESLANEWLALKDWEKVTKKRRLDMLKRVVFPTIGQLPVKQITPPVILQILKDAADKNGLSVMAEAKRTMFGIFELAAETFRVDSNPVHQWREALPKNKTQHKRALEVAEIGELLRDASGWMGRHETVSAFRLMWLTLARPNEACGARWDEIDLDAGVWKVQASRMKNRKPHTFPLSRQAVELLTAIKQVTGSTPYCFPHRDDRQRPMEIATFRQMLHVLGWSGKFSPHATRTTGSTRLNEIGFRPDIIEKQLAHTEPNAVRRTYNHAEYLDERAKMMQQWADMLDAWEQGSDGKVVALRAA